MDGVLPTSRQCDAAQHRDNVCAGVACVECWRCCGQGGDGFVGNREKELRMILFGWSTSRAGV